jgi:hypothetical protein
MPLSDYIADLDIDSSDFLKLLGEFGEDPESGERFSGRADVQQALETFSRTEAAFHDYGPFEHPGGLDTWKILAKQQGEAYDVLANLPGGFADINKQEDELFGGGQPSGEFSGSPEGEPAGEMQAGGLERIIELLERIADAVEDSGEPAELPEGGGALYDPDASENYSSSSSPSADVSNRGGQMGAGPRGIGSSYGARKRTGFLESGRKGAFGRGDE